VPEIAAAASVAAIFAKVDIPYIALLRFGAQNPNDIRMSPKLNV
jgi:hypothetical protein